ncbi:MAG: hypothetical protein E7774_01360 [Bradyrhizobium sp.]|nr:MAG: hypothetical protein E7774_01360 [Bradyrhizobium sp.]
MKPVPILQYLDHFGRVGSGDAQPAARAPSPAPFKPRNLRAVPDPAPRPQPAIARVLRETSAPRTERAPAPRPRAIPSEAEIEARLEAAYERGRRDGAQAARAEEAEALAQAVEAEREQAIESQLDFQLNEYAQIADQISTGLQEIEERVAEATARILGPLLAAETTKKIVQNLCESLAKLRVGGASSLIRIRGPERVLKALRERVAFLSVEVEYVAEDGVEVTIEAEETTIRSELQQWSDLIDSLTQ